MYTKLLGFLVIACQIVLNGSTVIHANSNSVHEVETLPTIRPPNLPEGYVIIHEDHAAYKIHTEIVKWNEARDRCISEGARLAITDSVEKIERINSVKNVPEVKWVHVGIHKLPRGREWVRVDNDLPMTFVPWVSWEVDASDDIEHCAGISLHENGLVHYECSIWEEYFVCEIPL